MYNLVLYEYFLTDAAGHGKNIDFAVTEIKKIESLIFNVVKRAKELDKAVIVCSDHGNIEDLRIKSHTNNPAFFAVWTNKLIKRITSLTEVKNLIIDLVNKN
jgi:bisphosphoglycerate-independent phosphoglycerate mutase (AlkP superfamily)